MTLIGELAKRGKRSIQDANYILTTEQNVKGYTKRFVEKKKRLKIEGKIRIISLEFPPVYFDEFSVIIFPW